MQRLCFNAATMDGVRTTQKVRKRIIKGFGEIQPMMLKELKADYAARVSKLVRTDEVSPPRGAAALLLWLLGRSPDGEVAVEVARLEYPMLSKAMDWLLGGSLAEAIETSGLTWLLEFEPGANILKAQDPRFLFYLRALDWAEFLNYTGHIDLYLGSDSLLRHRVATPPVPAPVPASAPPPVVASQPAEPIPALVPPPIAATSPASNNGGGVFVPLALAEALARRSVIPFAGAGVSRAVQNLATGRPLFPDWKELLVGAAERLRQSGKDGHADAVAGLVEIGESGTYLEAARRAQQGLGPLWFQYLGDMLEKPSELAEPDSLALARSLWELGSRLIITTNYDEVLRWACPDALQRDHRIWDISAPAEFAAMLRGGIKRATVWHLHGYVGNLNNIILTPDGYRRLYPENPLIRSTYEASLMTLRTILSSQTLLFVGFSFTDEIFGEQVRFIEDIFSGTTGPHFMMIEKAKLALTRERLRSLSSLELVPFTNRAELPNVLRMLPAHS